MIDLPDDVVCAIGEALIFEAVERHAHLSAIEPCTTLVAIRGGVLRPCGSSGVWTPYIDPLGRAQGAYLCPLHGGRVLP